MQHSPGTKFDRSTIWRRKKKADRSTTSERDKFTTACAEFDKRHKSGRKRADLNEIEILSFVAGVIDKLNDEGVFHPAKLSRLKRHPENGQKILVPISGKKATIRELEKLGLPCGLLLSSIGHLLFGKRPANGKALKDKDGFGLMIVHSAKLEKSASTKGERIAAATHRIETREYALGSQGATIESSDGSKEYIKDLSQVSVAPDRKPTPLHRVREFRELGITRAMASYWRNHFQADKAQKSIARLIAPCIKKYRSGEFDSRRLGETSAPKNALYRLPLLSAELNKNNDALTRS